MIDILSRLVYASTLHKSRSDHDNVLIVAVAV